MSVADRVRQAVGRRPASIESVPDRLEALHRFVDAVGEFLPDERLASARAVRNRAGERLALSREHTVVALAGSTGSGKSSLFNALAGVDLSPVGVTRPTTAAAHAALWGGSGAGALLDWLGVPPSRRFDREATLDGRGDRRLHGLVLLDLPDFDSVERSHRVEVDRLLTLVDLVVWVLDPQKYADRLVHKAYLAQFRRHRDITVVVLNQADRLDPADTERCLYDLRALLDDDGLGGVPVLATSAVGPPGLDPLRTALERTVAAREAALRRLGDDVDVLVAELAPLVSAAVADDEIDGPAVRDLIGALTNVAGVPVVAAATERAYVHRAIRSTGWPVLRWVRRVRPDPLRRLRLGTRPAAADQEPVPARAGHEPGRGGSGHQPALVAATSIPPAPPAARAALGLALRTVGQRAGEGLPDPWPEAVLAAARSTMDDLPDALDLAIARTDLGVSKRPLWWRAVGAVQWLSTLVALVGLGWLAVRYALFALALPEPPTPQAGRLPLPTLLLFGGLLGGLLVSIVVRPLVRIAARRKRKRATARMRDAVEQVALTLVVAPVRRVRRAYADGRTALRAASTSDPWRG